MASTQEGEKQGILVEISGKKYIESFFRAKQKHLDGFYDNYEGYSC